MKATLNTKAILELAIKVTVVFLAIPGFLIAVTPNDDGFYNGVNIIGAAMVFAGVYLAKQAERKKWISFPFKSDKA